jgi:hypothetical protein
MILVATKFEHYVVAAPGRPKPKGKAPVTR